MSEKKSQQVNDLEKAKEEILRKIADKVNSDETAGEEFGASHSSHTSSSKHSSQTH